MSGSEPLSGNSVNLVAVKAIFVITAVVKLYWWWC